MALYRVRIIDVILLVLVSVVFNQVRAQNLDDACDYAENVWFKHEYGLERTVPKPWKAITIEEYGLNLHRKKILFNRSLLPSQVLVDDQPVFQGPAELILRIDGEDIQSTDFENRTDESDGYSVSLLSKLDKPKFDMTITKIVEFDGFIKLKLKINPSQKINLNHLSFVFPLKDSISKHYLKYLDYDFEKQEVSKEGLENTSGSIQYGNLEFPFTPTLWVGSGKAGIEWISESNLNYSLAKGSAAYSINKTLSGTDFVVNIINKDIQIDNSIEYEFGIFITPLKKADKAIPKGTFMTRSMSVEDAVDYAKRYPFLNPIYMAHWRRMPVEYPGLPFPSTSDENQYLELVKATQRGGLKFIPYSSLYIMPSNVPEIIDYEDCWASANKRGGSKIWRERTGKSKAILPVTLEEHSIQQYLLFQHINTIEKYETDGIYLDVSMFWELEIARERFLDRHFVSKEMREHIEFYPLFSHRKFMQRLWKSTKKINDQFLILSHTGTSMPRFVSAYSDVTVFGESFHRLFSSETDESSLSTVIDRVVNAVKPKRYLPDYKLLPLSLLERYSIERGQSYMLLPEVERSVNKDYLKNNPKDYIKWSRSVIAVAIERDFALWHTRINPKVLDKFLSLLDEADYYHGETVQIDVPENVFSFDHGLSIYKLKLFQAKNNLLLYIYNDAEMDSAVIVDLNNLHYENPHKVINLESREVYDASESKIVLPSKDFVLLKIMRKNDT